MAGRSGNRTQSIATSPGVARQTATLLRRLAIETDGQDMVEYALLTTFIGFAGAAGWTLMRMGLGTIYGSYVGAVWSLWEPADPVGGGGGGQ